MRSPLHGFLPAGPSGRTQANVAGPSEAAPVKAVPPGFTAEACQAHVNEGEAEKAPVTFAVVALATLLFVAILTAVEWLRDRQQHRDTAPEWEEAGRPRDREEGRNLARRAAPDFFIGIEYSVRIDQLLRK